ncbi:G2/mitotic-specific cyclin-B [Battus philenor]|uniref:G2/mitotic-specific cyclin-B n=1 Tax=Battus philenor TaxID=42288 RepID=UPI0035CFDAC8
MEIQFRRPRTVHHSDQENIYAKGKINLGLPIKRQGLTVRGALDELNTNVQAQRDANVSKKAIAAAEIDKKASRNALRTSNYSHVQSKIDTGLASKSKLQPSSRPVLRREESTAALAARAAARTKAILKDSQNEPNQFKEPSNANIVKVKKNTQDGKKNCKLPAVWDTLKDNKNLLKPVIKDPSEYLGKLKLSEASTKTLNGIEEGVKPWEQPIPEDIEDIDAGDNNSPLLMSIYIKDIYRYLTELEEKYPIEFDHLRKQTVITGKMRATLLDWLVEVHCQFSLMLETFHLTVGIIDRYLQVAPNVQRNELQLIGVTAMFIASKYEEIYPPEIRDFVYVTDNAYKKADVFCCERKIMTQLGFCLARPIPLSFLRRFVKAAKGTSKNHHLAKYFVDLSLVEYTMSHYRPSELASAAICLSLHLLSTKSLKEVWTPTLKHYSGYSLEHIQPIITKLANIVINVENSKFQAVPRKYADISLAKVSTLPQLTGEAIHIVANTPQGS